MAAGTHENIEEEGGQNGGEASEEGWEGLVVGQRPVVDAHDQIAHLK